MAEQQVALQQKKELNPAEERTEAGRFFSPYTDIHETAAAVVVTMEMPGIDKSTVDIRVDKGVLTIKATVDAGKYATLRPIYSEYNVGNFIRTFTVSTKIDSGAISAKVVDGVLTVTLPKAAEAVAKRIAVH
jgi:HSP20 family molecular chaperone IbpA